jgi:cyclase
MKKRRIIPVVLLREGFLVQSKGFARYQNLGNPMSAVKRLSEWGSDELIYLDITRGETYDQRRDDLRHPNRRSLIEIVKDVAAVSFMPITFGGGIRSVEQIHDLIRNGADKVAITSEAVRNPDFISQAAHAFGAQCIVVGIDVRLEVDGTYQVYADGGREPTGRDPLSWAREAESRGAGDILLQAIHCDGLRQGFDLGLIDKVSKAVHVPVIALGGAGELEHFSQVLEQTSADAVAAANIFNYMDQSMYLIRQHLYERKLNVRAPSLHTFGERMR